MKDRQNRVIYVLSDEFFIFSLELGYFDYFFTRISKLIIFAISFTMIDLIKKKMFDRFSALPHPRLTNDPPHRKKMFTTTDCLSQLFHILKLLSVSFSYFWRFNMSI